MTDNGTAEVYFLYTILHASNDLIGQIVNYLTDNINKYYIIILLF